jgi:hypothetical protein
MYIIFGTFCLTGLLHVFILFPESCGKTLEELDIVFEQGIWQFNANSPPSDLEAKINAAKEVEEKCHVDVV